ncbi:MAG: redoxin domain-containing protein [Planctomycetales bacterium]
MSVSMMISYVALWAIVVILAIVLIGAIRQIGLLHRRIPPTGARMAQPGPDVGQKAPDFSEMALDGSLVTLSDTALARTLLVFMSVTCQACADLAPAIRSVAASERKLLRVIIVAKGGKSEVSEFARENHLLDIPTIVAPELQELYDVHASPYGILVERNLQVRSKGVLNTLEHLDSLLQAAESGIDSRETAFELLSRTQPVLSGSTDGE